MITLTKEQMAREVALIENKKDWPMGPVLPVKLLGRTGMDGMGVLFEEDVKPVIYLGANPFALSDAGLSLEELRAELEKYKKLSFESVLAMVEAGWVGD